MKLVIALALIGCAISIAGAEEKRYVDFDGTEYYFADEQGNDRERLSEYVPLGQAIAEWNELVSIRTINGVTDAKAYAANLKRAVLNSSPIAQCVVAEKNKVVIVDFLTWPPDMSYGEFNMMKVIAGKAGLKVYQYAKKWRGDDWGEKLKAERMRLYEVVYDATFEEKTEPNQSPQRNAGSRPSSMNSPASETPSSLGPRG